MQQYMNQSKPNNGKTIINAPQNACFFTILKTSCSNILFASFPAIYPSNIKKIN